MEMIILYLAISAAVYPFFCGLHWSRFGYFLGWDSGATLFMIVASLVWPLAIFQMPLMYLTNRTIDWIKYRPQFIFKKRKPVNERW